jgi:1,4-dihydroxy-2-naphthoate octaprenyltransferase
MNTGKNLDTNLSQTHDGPSQVEASTLPAAADAPAAEDAAPASAEASELPPLPPLPPRRTIPLPPSDGAAAGMAPVAAEQALVATDQRSGLPLAPAALPGRVERWWGVLRPGMFWLSLAPVILGALIAWLESLGSSISFHPFRLLFLILAVLALHGGANLLNEAYDVLRGTDGRHALGSRKIIQRELLAVDGVRRAGLVLLALGALDLLILTLTTHIWGALVLGGASLLLAYFYSATRYALAYFPLSEVAIGFVMGPAALFASVQLQGAPVDSLAITFALALGALAAAVMLANNLRDLETDRAANKRTLVTYIGAQPGRILYLALILLPYLLIALVAFPHARPHGALLVLLTLPTLFVAITGALRAETPAASHLVVEQTLRLHRLFSCWLLTGYVLSVGVAYLLSLF